MLPIANIFTALGLSDVLSKLHERYKGRESPVEVDSKPFLPNRFLPVGVGRASYFLPSDQGISEVGYSQQFIRSIDDEQTPAAMVLFRNEFDVYGGSVVDALPIRYLVPYKNGS